MRAVLRGRHMFLPPAVQVDVTSIRAFISTLESTAASVGKAPHTLRDTCALAWALAKLGSDSDVAYAQLFREFVTVRVVLCPRACKVCFGVPVNTPVLARDYCLHWCPPVGGQ